MKGKVIVITGASGGIGAAAAEALAKRGATLVLVARRKAALDDVATRCAGLATVVVADVSRRDDVRRVVAETLAAKGHIDVWINNAGKGITRVPSELTDADVNEMMQLNVMTALYGMQEVVPHFKARGEGQVINISSMLARIPFAAFRSAYSASKHFLNALTSMMRTEVQQEHPGIQFTLVSPGVVRTEFGKNAVHGGPDSRELPNSQSAEEIAEVIVQAVESRAPDLYTRKGAQALVAGHYATIGVDP